MFKVEIVRDEHQEGVRWLKASHNGVAWSLIEFRSNEEAIQIMVALQQSAQLTGCLACGDSGVIRATLPTSGSFHSL